MKIKKLSLLGIKNELSRDELKKIMAGSGGGCTDCNPFDMGYNAQCCACYNNGDPHPLGYFNFCLTGDCTEWCIADVPLATYGVPADCYNCGG